MKKRMTSGLILASLACILLLASGCLPAAQPAVNPASTATEAPGATPAPTAAAETPSPAPEVTPAENPGLILAVPVLTKNVITVGIDNREDGTYREELLFDTLVNIVIERVKRAEANEQAIAKQIDSLNGIAAKGIVIAKDDAVSAKVTYPAWRITYETGENEDTRSNLDIYIQTDDWDFRFHTAVHVDSVDFKYAIAEWIEAIELTQDVSSSATASAETQPPAPETTPAGSLGLFMAVPVLTRNVVTVGIENREDGTYREELLFDTVVGIVIERVKRAEANEQAIARQIDSLNGTAAKDITIAKDDAVSAKVTYPAWRITYETGENEDTRSNLDIYIQTDDWDFRFHITAPADNIDDYKYAIPEWIEAVELFDGK